jgi:triacylglycerol lipase
MKTTTFLPLLLSLPMSLTACLGGSTSSVAEGEDQDIAELSASALPAVPARHAIILAHGFNASSTNQWSFFNVADTLRKAGNTVYVADVPPYSSVAVRAAHLSGFVDDALADGAEKVNIIAHSMGGLDARYLISSLGYGDVVASLTSISTPHQGSAVADVALDLLPSLGSADDAIDDLASLWGLTFSDVAGDSDVRAALSALAEASAPAFNRDNPDDPRVFYQSWAGVSSVGGISNPADRFACEGLLFGQGKADKMNAQLVPGAAFVAHGLQLRPNDGMATVEGAKWGQFRGCIRADHLDEVGQIRHTGPDARTGFDHLVFYRDITRDLAARGF